jgi:hypothetical protein
MKKYLLLFFLIAIIIFAISCKETKRSDLISAGVKTISLPDAIGKERIVNLSEVAQSIRYIPLETSDSSLLGRVFRPVLENGVFYLTVHSGFKTEYKMYSINGKYLGKLGRFGRAAGEYLSDLKNYTLSVDIKSGNPMIFSTDKIIEYDKEGRFIKEVKFPIESNYNVIFNKVKKLGDNYFSIITDFKQNKSICLFFDASGDIIGEMPQMLKTKSETGVDFKSTSEEIVTPIQTVFTATSFNSEIYDYKDNLRMLPGGNDTLFTFNPDMERAPLYYFDFGKYKLPANATGEQRSQSIFLVLGFTCEWEGHLFLTYNFGNNETNGYTPPLVRAVYNKKSGELTLLKRVTPELGGLKNDLDNGAPFWPVYISREEEMIAVVSAMQFIELSKEYDSPEMKRVAATLNENSNPVMVVVK